MTEQEYVNATSLAKIRTAYHLLLDIETNDDEIHDSYLRKARHSLRKLEDIYTDIIDIEESE